MNRIQMLLITTILASSSIFAQSGPLRFAQPFRIDNSESLPFVSDVLIPDSAVVSMARISFCLFSEGKSQPFHLALSNSGGLVAFRDSLYRIPIRLEKRNSFPFRKLQPGRKFKLLYTCRPGEGDYFGFRLMEENKQSQILDEVLWCSPDSKSTLQFSAIQGWIKER